MSDQTVTPTAAIDPSVRGTVVVGFVLLAVFLPIGLTLEALHALKVQVYLGSSMRREMWTLAHAHGGVLGILCLCYGGLAERWIRAGRRRSVAIWLRLGAVLMPVGFFLGGVANFEGDPSLGILLVPLGGLALLIALLQAARSVQRSGSE